MFSKERIESWNRLVARYPEKRAALLPMLHDVQADLGCITAAAMEWVAAFLDISPADVQGVVTFYWMYDRKPRARYRLAVCRNICCDVRGADAILRTIEDKLEIKAGERSGDGLFSLRAVECMGACTAAPMLDLNGEYHENLTPEKTARLVDGLLAERSRSRTAAAAAGRAAVPATPASGASAPDRRAGGAP